MATVSTFSIVIVVCLAVANGTIIGGLGNCTTPTGDVGFKCASGNCIASNLWRNGQCDCCGSSPQPNPPPPSCSDCSDELCQNNQTACDFGKCIHTATLASATTLKCTYDCIQSNLYTACIQNRTTTPTTMTDNVAWATFCTRLALRPPLDCNSTATCPCLTQMQNYCTNKLYDSQFSRETVSAGKTSSCGTNTAGTTTGCTSFCSTNQPTAVASSLRGVCMADPVTSNPYCSCRMPMVVPCTLCMKGTC